MTNIEAFAEKKFNQYQFLGNRESRNIALEWWKKAYEDAAENLKLRYKVIPESKTITENRGLNEVIYTDNGVVLGVLDNSYAYCFVRYMRNKSAMVSNGSQNINVIKSKLTIVKSIPWDYLLEIAKNTREQLFSIIKFYREGDIGNMDSYYMVLNNCINKAIEENDKNGLTMAIHNAMDNIDSFYEN